MSKVQQLEIELAKYKAEAKVWEKAFKIIACHSTPPINDTLCERVESKKTAVENFEEGQRYAEKQIIEVYDIKELEQIAEAQAKGEAVGVQNALLAGITNTLRRMVVEYVVGTLVRLLKDNAVNIVDWLCGQLDGQIVDGYMRLSEEDKFLLKNQLKEYPRFAELLKKIEEREQD